MVSNVIYQVQKTCRAERTPSLSHEHILQDPCTLSLMISGRVISQSKFRYELYNGLIDKQDQPLISCLMVTKNRCSQARMAIDCFMRQTYSNKELVIVNDDDDSQLTQYVDSLQDDRIRLYKLSPQNQTLGELRNLAIQKAAGDYICQWDDDDLYDPKRLEWQMAALQSQRADACFLQRLVIWWPKEQRAALSRIRTWENSILCHRHKVPRYPEITAGEDTPVTQHILQNSRVILLDQPLLYIYIVHGHNTCTSDHFEQQWQLATAQYQEENYEELLSQLRNRLPLDDFNTTHSRSSSASNPDPIAQTSSISASQTLLNTRQPVNPGKSLESLDRSILLYHNNNFFEDKEYIPLTSDQLNHSVELILDRSNFFACKCVVFHIPSLVEDDLLSLPFYFQRKPIGQVWVAYGLESVANYPALCDPKLMKMFDYEISYRQSADLWYPYIDPPILKGIFPRTVNPKTGFAAAFISSTINQSKRQEYLAELMKYIPVDSYGLFMNNASCCDADSRYSIVGQNTKIDIISRYRFTIAFENSISLDYVTEKFYQPLIAGSIPIYLGAPNVSEFSPGKQAYIDVNDFKDPKDLSEFLKTIDDESYHQWRHQPLRSSFTSKIERLNKQGKPFQTLCKLVFAPDDR